MKLDEQALRKPSFLGGRPVTLADGQEWTIPVPVRLFMLDESNEDGFRTVTRFAGEANEEFDRRWDAYEKAKTGAEFIRANLRLMLYMLQMNYDLTSEQAAPLIPISFQSDAPDPIRETFISAGKGEESPKPSAVGSHLL